MHEVLVNGSGALSLPRKSVVRLTDGPNMTSDVYHKCKTPPQPKKSLGVSKKGRINFNERKSRDQLSNPGPLAHHIGCTIWVGCQWEGKNQCQ